MATRTDGGSTAFANPSVTALRTPAGQRAPIVALIIPGEATAHGEGGELIYYTTY
jgi:hypothetical protein